MKNNIYLCRCSQELSLNGRQLDEHLCKRPDELKPGSIVSCFKTNFNKEDILTSAILFMNLHHSDLPPSLLERIADAEFKRLDSVSIKTNTFNVGNDVAAIFSETRMFDDFVNTYGGVLEIKPVVMKRLFLPDAHAGEIEGIEGELGRYRISLRVPSVIDLQSCTYCGVCIKVCPVGCIGDSLSVDLVRCDYCGECERHCPQNAIDLHRYLQTEIEASQVLLDDELKVRLPDDQRGIHRTGSLEELFANIGEYQVSELIRHTPSLCQYHSGFDSGCKRCLESCPAKAIGKNDEGLYIDHFRCEGCGSCVLVCPTGAMQYLPFDDELFLNYLKIIEPAGYSVVIAGEDALKRFHFRNIGRRFEGVIFIEHPAPVALHSAQLLGVFCMGVRRLYIGDINREAEFVNSLLKDLFGIEEFIMPFSYEEGVFKPVDNPLGLPLEIKHAPRHIFLAHIIQELMKEAGVSAFNLNRMTDRFAEIQCDAQRCSLCLACVNVCNAGAMRAVQDDFSLRFNPSFCINCGLCVELCPEKALSSEMVQQIEESFFDEKLLARDEPMHCRRCGKLFGNRRVFDEVVRRLTEAGLFQERGRFLDFCEDCRVIAMFEEPEGEE